MTDLVAVLILWLIAGVGLMFKETIEWVNVDEQLPDDEFTVLFAANGLNEPVWLGYHLSSGWYTADGLAINPGCVTHWADMPAGPNLLAGGDE